MTIEAYLAKKMLTVFAVLIFFGSLSTLIATPYESIYLLPLLVSGYYLTK